MNRLRADLNAEIRGHIASEKNFRLTLRLGREFPVEEDEDTDAFLADLWMGPAGLAKTVR